jgi:GDPmannose 4,6-dehydratase/GDP-4-dehydro-6-deoxy-D-mannose reductase
MNKKFLITGILGSGGSYLAEYLLDKGDVHGIARWHTAKTVREKSPYVIHECDLLDISSIIRALKASCPDVIFHIASHANVRAGFDTPLAVIQNNVMGTANLLEAIRILEINPIIMLCSTSEVYGQRPPGSGPISESAEINPVSPYAVSKLTQDALGYTYFKSFGLKVVRTRMFTYLNPRRADLFATSFAMQVARIEAGLQEELVHGNLDSVRTMLDVRDAVRAYGIAAEKGIPGEVYNIGGTETMTVGKFLEKLKSMARCSIPSRQDPALVRPMDVTLQIPDCTKFKQTTGWEPEISFDDSVEFLLNHCRTVVA